MRRVWRSITVIVALLALPLLGMWVGSLVAPWTYSTRVDSNDADSFASTAWALHLVRLLSLSALSLGGGLILATWLALPLAGRSRRLLATVFGPFVKLACCMVMLLSLVHVAIAGLLIWLLTLHELGISLPTIALSPLLAAAAGAVEMGRGGFQMARPHIARIIGCLLPRDTEPALWSDLRDIARKLDTAMPAHVVIGLLPGVWATAGTCYVMERERFAGQHLRGGVLYLSLPMMSVLSVDEFHALIAHAMHQFMPGHRVFSASLIPALVGLVEGRETARGRPGMAGSLLRPAALLLGAITDAVWRSYARHTRDLCHEADRASARICDATMLMSAGLKAALLDDFWATQHDYAKDQIRRGEQPQDFAQVMAAEQVAALNRVNRNDLHLHVERLGTAADGALKPSFVDRGRMLHVPLKAMRAAPSDGGTAAASLLGDPAGLDAAVSNAFRDLMVRTGEAVPPRDPNRHSAVAKQRSVRLARAQARRPPAETGSIDPQA